MIDGLKSWISRGLIQPSMTEPFKVFVGLIESVAVCQGCFIMLRRLQVRVQRLN